MKKIEREFFFVRKVNIVKKDVLLQEKKKAFNKKVLLESNGMRELVHIQIVLLH